MSISACLITKNEEKWLPGCIDHLLGVVTEFIVVDTGSTDQTISLAKERGARVSQIKWENDFSKARNQSLEKATQRWILVIDPDERIADKDLVQLQELIKNADAIAYSFSTRNYSTNTSASGFQVCKGEYPELEKPYPGYFESSKIRLFQNIPSIRFQGSVHELVEPTIKGKVLSSSIPFHHYGSTEEVVMTKNKRDFYQQRAEQKVKEEPGNWKAHFERGIEYLTGGNFGEAVKALQQAYALAPQIPLVLSNYGYALMETGQHAEAERVLKDCIVFSPKNQDAWLNLGVNEMRQKNWDKALHIFDSLLQEHPRSFLAYRNAGNCFAHLKKLKEAAGCFQKSLEIMPDFVDAKIDLGIVCFAAGRADMAKNLLQEALQKQPNSLRARALLDEMKA